MIPSEITLAMASRSRHCTTVGWPSMNSGALPSKSVSRGENHKVRLVFDHRSEVRHHVLDPCVRVLQPE